MSSPQSLLCFCLRRPCSSCSVLKKYSSEEPGTFLYFPVLPQVMIIDNFWFPAFSFFPFCPYFYPCCTSSMADRAQWYAIAFLCCSFCGFVAMCSWQTRCGERKGSQPFQKKPGNKEKNKSKGWGLGYPWFVEAARNLLPEQAYFWREKLHRGVGVPTCKRVLQHSFHFKNLLFLVFWGVWNVGGEGCWWQSQSPCRAYCVSW